jgi:hypothetical protein
MPAPDATSNARKNTQPTITQSKVSATLATRPNSAAAPDAGRQPIFSRSHCHP